MKILRFGLLQTGLKRRAKNDPTRKAFDDLGVAVENLKVAIVDAVRRDVNRITGCFQRIGSRFRGKVK